jgi:hypothetical protein
LNLTPRDRWFALCGVASVVVELVGTFVQLGSKDTHSLTWTSSDAAISKAFSQHATTVVWTGAYLEIVSMGLFLAFALWAARKLGGGLLGAIASGFAVANVAVSTVSLAMLDASAYLAGKSLPLSTARTLVVINGATYVATWFLTAFFLLALTPLALTAGKRIVGWSGAGIAALILVSTASDPTNLGQLSGGMLPLIWIAGTSLAFLRREPQGTVMPAVS